MSHAGTRPAVDAPVAAVDVGGTTIKAALVGEGGRITHRRVLPTPVAEGPDAVVAAVRAEVGALLTAARDAGLPATAAVGVVVPGVVDAAAGIARWAANIGWRDVSLRDLLGADTGLACAVEHDVRAAGVAEAAFGRVTGVDDALLAVIGTGIAAVVWSAGRQIAGATRVAGELGHVPIWPDGEACPCGQRGCLERYASAGALVRRYRAASGRVVTAQEVVTLAAHDGAASRVWADAIAALGIGLATCTMLLDPAVIVLGGGLSGAGEPFRAAVAAALGSRVAWREPPPVELSPLGADAGLLGAAVHAARLVGARCVTRESSTSQGARP